MGAASGRFLWTSRMSRGPAATGHEPMLIEEGLHRKSVSRTWARHLRSEGAHIRRYEIRTTSLADVWNNPGQWTPTASSAHLPWPPKILADRWTPLIVRELLAGHTRFNDLHRRLPRISRSILSDRLPSSGRGSSIGAWAQRPCARLSLDPGRAGSGAGRGQPAGVGQAKETAPRGLAGRFGRYDSSHVHDPPPQVPVTDTPSPAGRVGPQCPWI